MSDSVLEKIRKMKERQQERTSFPSYRGTFHTWKDGDNIIRLLGGFLEVRTHYICGNPKKGERGLCQGKAFVGANHIQQTINCMDWDVEKEEPKTKKTCPICALNRIARAALKENPTPEEKKFFDNLKQIAYARTALKWHIIDREDPYVNLVENGKEIKVKGLKVSSIGAECWKDIEGIYDQCGFDIADPEEGIDIVVTRNSGNKTSYAAKAVLFGRPPAAKITPLTEEEKQWKMYDLKALCGKQVDMDALMDALHPDLRELLELNSEEAAPAPTPAPSAAPRRQAPPAAKAPVQEEEEDGGDPLDDDGGLGPVKKK